MSNPAVKPSFSVQDLKNVVDWNAMRAQSAQVIADFLTPLVEGAAADIQYIANDISKDFQLALLLPEGQGKPLIEEMGAQIGLLAERNRIRLVNGQWDAVAKGLVMAGSIVSAFAAAASSGVSQALVLGLNSAISGTLAPKST